MDCPNCGTWNPDDKKVCWRCQTPLPTPVPEKKRKSLTIFGLPAWLFLVIIIFLLAPVFSQCLGLFPRP